MHTTIEFEALRAKNDALQKQLDERNEATKVWVQAETQTREYANKLEKALRAITELECCPNSNYPGCKTCRAIDVIAHANLGRAIA